MKYDIKILLWLFISFSCPVYGQETSSKIDKKDLSDFIKTLTSIRFEGRGIDNDGQLKTQEFIVDRFKELQLEPFTPDGYLEKFALRQTDRAEIYMSTPSRKILKNLDRMIFDGDIRRNETIEREVVFGGYGTDDELNRINVESRIVMVVLRNQRDEYAVKKRLEERNASGLIVFYEDDREFDLIKTRVKDFYTQKRYSIVDNCLATGTSQEEASENVSATPVFYTIKIPGQEVKNITGLSKNKLVTLAMTGKISKAPPTRFTIHFDRVDSTVVTANVAGVIKGESEQSIIISAHYDHVGKVDKVYYPGADDNASGIAALLELAEEFAQQGANLKYKMVFLATTAEEAGLLGSLYHTEHPDFDPEKVFCSINIDMISRCDNYHKDCDYLYCIGDGQSPALDSLVMEAGLLYPPCVIDNSGNQSGIFARSDAYSFKKKESPPSCFFRASTTTTTNRPPQLTKSISTF